MTIKVTLQQSQCDIDHNLMFKVQSDLDICTEMLNAMEQPILDTNAGKELS
jgi:hypothetical protein